MRKELLILILLLFISFPAVKSLFIPGGFTSHDLTHHVVRQISMDKLLSEGQFPPRWSADLNNGYGYPVFLFNYPLPALVGEIFHKMGFGFVDSVKVVLFLSMVISTAGMYLFLKSLLNSKLAAFLGSIFYLYAPLRFLNVYVSAAVGSSLALGILPFVFWAMVSNGNRGNKRNRGDWGILTGGIFFAALILSHNVTALIFAPVVLAFTGLVSWRVRDVRVVREVGGMVLLGLGLSAWFWMPALIEAQYTRFDLIFGKFYTDQFPSIWQLIRSPWGYGLSHPQNPEPGDMSYQIGLVHIGVMLVMGGWLVVGGGKIKDRLLGIFTLGTFATSVFLMLKVSLPLWENVPFLAMVQFPLRFQAWSIFAASIAVALFFKWIPAGVYPVLRHGAGMTVRRILFVSLLILVIYANRNHWNINQVFDPGEEYYLSLKTTSTTYGEHLPKWGGIMDKPSPGKLEIIGGRGEVRVVRDQSARVLAEVELKEAAQLRLNQFYFPGWEIKVDGKPVDFNYLTDGESYGLMVFDVEEGKHLVEAKFKSTPIRNLADLVSLVSLGLWVGLSLRGARRSRAAKQSSK